MTADEACSRGLVSRVVPPEKTVDEALAIATKIASKSNSTVLMAKECVNQAFETSLAEGLKYEKRLFWSTFAT